jgi:hypothetical protein
LKKFFGHDIKIKIEAIMKKMKLLLAIISLTALSSFLPSHASTLPPADIDSVSIGVGLLGPGLSIDVPVAPRVFTGLSVSLPIFYPGNLFGTIRYNLYGAYQIIKEKDSKLAFAGVLGIWGDRNFVSTTYSNTIAAFQLGFAVAYTFTEQFRVRVNIIAALPASDYGIIAPAAGFELVYTPSKNIELSAGLNGQGDIFGARWHF